MVSFGFDFSGLGPDTRLVRSRGMVRHYGKDTLLTAFVGGVWPGVGKANPQSLDVAPLVMDLLS